MAGYDNRKYNTSIPSAKSPRAHIPFLAPIMLLLLLVVHTLSTAGRPVPALYPRASADSCDDINSCRKLFDIVWGCLATIFACTWVSVHPNVPPPNQTRIALLWRRLKMMLIGVIAPELMVGFAARQFLVARLYSTGSSEISMTHAFFVSMGGFVARDGSGPIATSEYWHYLSDIRAVDIAAIQDKSKGDMLTKGVALLQGLWFILQCLARVHQHLPVTELEVATLAFAVVNIFVWILWWHKPLDVQHPIQIGPAATRKPVREPRISPVHEPEMSESPVRDSPKLDPPDDRDSIEDNTKPAVHVRMSVGEFIMGAILGTYRLELLSDSVPPFWSSTDHLMEQQLAGLLTTFLVSIIFGGIHCAAWNAGFPSAEEMWIWRTCAALVTALPLVVPLTFAIVIWGDSSITGTMSSLLLLLLAILAGVYIMARLSLIILPLISLRALPPGALIDVKWSAYIPHL